MFCACIPEIEVNFLKKLKMLKKNVNLEITKNTNKQTKIYKNNLCTEQQGSKLTLASSQQLRVHACQQATKPISKHWKKDNPLTDSGDTGHCLDILLTPHRSWMDLHTPNLWLRFVTDYATSTSTGYETLYN